MFDRTAVVETLTTILIFIIIAGSLAVAQSQRQSTPTVSVYQAPLDAPPPKRAMPDGCKLLHTTSPVSMTELEIEGQKDPFRTQRKETAAAGGNALLVLSKVTIGRRDFECPSTSRITDCPPSSGAWLQVVFESYSCTP